MPDINLHVDEETTIVVHHDESNTVEVDRCDFVGKLGSVKRTDEGYLRGDAAIAKIGILKYLLPDGTTRRELVPKETLFDKLSMDSLKLQPITDRHPPEMLLDKTTVKRRRVGTTGETIKNDGNFLMTSIVVTDDDAISNVESGRQELSPGYRAKLVMQKGIYKGDEYDAVQIGRKYNHVAICSRARGGSDLRLNLDSVDIEHIDGFEIEDAKIDTNNQGMKPSRKELSMPKYRIDGIDYEAAQEVVNHITKLQTKVDELDITLKETSTSKTELQAKHDEAVEKVGSLEKRDIKKDVRDGVSARFALLKTANVVLDAEEIKKVDDLDDAAIKKAIIMKRSPNANLDEKDEIYVNARFDAVVEGLDFDPDASAKNRGISGKRQDGENHDAVEKARLDSEEAIKTGYQNLPKQYA